MIHFQAPRRFTIFVLTAIALIALTVTGCQQKQAGPPAKITIAYTNTISPGLVHIAMAKDYFAQEGIAVTLQPHSNGKLALDSLMKGKADVATAADTPIMFAVMGGKKMATIAVISTSNRNIAILARKDRGISKPADLKGKNIGIVRGTISDFFADLFLTAHNIERRQVNIVSLTVDEMIVSISKGKVDAISMWQPIRAQLQKNMGNKGNTFYAETIYTEIFCLAAEQEYVKKNPEAIKKVLRALLRAEKFVQQHSEEARHLVAKIIKIDKSILDKIWDIYNFQVTLDQALLVDLEEQTRWAIKNQLTARKDIPNYLDYIYVDGLQAVKPEAVRIIR